QYAGKAAEFATRVRDMNELLVEIGPRASRRRIEAKVAYHDACHLAHAQRIRSQPRALLESIPGIEIVPIAEQEVCCGSAGIWTRRCLRCWESYRRRCEGSFVRATASRSPSPAQARRAWRLRSPTASSQVKTCLWG